MVFRGGFGIFFIPNYVSFGTNPYVDPVSSATSNFFSSNDHGVSPAATLNTNTCADHYFRGGEWPRRPVEPIDNHVPF